MKRLISGFFFLALGAPALATICQRLHGVVGAEDIEYDRESGLIFISSQDRRTRQAYGNFYVMKEGDTQARILKIRGSAPGFYVRTHGISLYREANKLFVFAINHVAPNVTNVERFRYENGELLYLETIRSKVISNANDLRATSSRQFFITQDHESPSMWTRAWEDLFNKKSGSVYFYNGASFSRLNHKFAYPNGITTSWDHRRLYVASTMGYGVDVFEKNLHSHQWEWRETFKVPGMPDNLNWDTRGQLIVGLQVSKLDFARHVLSDKARAGSRIGRILMNVEGRPVKNELIFEDLKGSSIAAASVGTVAGNSLFVGAVFEGHLLRCRVQ